MTTFGWKRKLGSNVSKEATTKFVSGELDIKEDKAQHHDWMSSFKRRKTLLVKNEEKKGLELKEEGAVLAENGRYKEALMKLENAIQLIPYDAKLHEMKAQALLQLDQFFLAIQATEKSILLDPVWWIAYQTLGRAQLAIGEIKMAIISFSKALHINPAVEELWKNDLNTSLKIFKERKKLAAQEEFRKAEVDTPKMILNEDGFVKAVLENTTEIDKTITENIVQCRF